MKQEEVKLVRFTANEGKSLKWRQRIWNFREHKFEEEEMFAERTTIIDINQLIIIEEIPHDEYLDWYRKIGNTYGISSIF